MIPCLITSYNQLSMLRGMVKDCFRLGLDPIVVDNGSTYPPLLEWLDTNPCQVERLGDNFGPNAAWTFGVIWRLMKEKSGYYIVTDGDLDLSRIPDDAADVLVETFEANPQVTKVGFSLEIDDLPDNPLTEEVRNHEAQFWTGIRDDGHYDAAIDTTFALYHTDRKFEAPAYAEFFTAIRLGRPYTARHVPWYLDFENPTDEQRYCLEKTDDHLSVWSTKIKRRLSGVSDEATTE